MPKIYLYASWSVGLLLVLVVMAYALKSLFKTDEATNAKNTEKRSRELESAGVSLSYPLNQYSDFADRIQLALATYSALDDDPAEAVYILADLMQTERDVLQLKQTYGTRPDKGFSFVSYGDKNLAQLVQAELDPGEIAEINQAYAQKNIIYQF